MIVVDVETTGPYPGKYGLVSIGALEFEKPSNQFYVECQIDPEHEVSTIALHINGFSEEQIRDSNKPTEAEAVKLFIGWAKPISDKTLAGHNTYFDAGFLRTAASKLKTDPNQRVWPFLRRFVDAHSLAYTEMKRRGWPVPLRFDGSVLWSGAIDVLCGLPVEPEPHNALTGAKIEAETIHRLIYGKGLLAEYEQYPVPDYLKIRLSKMPNPPPLPLPPDYPNNDSDVKPSKRPSRRGSEPVNLG